MVVLPWLGRKTFSSTILGCFGWPKNEIDIERTGEKQSNLILHVGEKYEAQRSNPSRQFLYFVDKELFVKIGQNKGVFALSSKLMK